MVFRINDRSNIGKKADEIEDFVSQIIQASSEEFLNLEVKTGEFYLSQLMTETLAYRLLLLEQLVS